MKKLLLLISLSFFISCASNSNKENSISGNDDARIDSLFKNYYEQRLHLFPLEATQNGDHRFDDQLPNNITQSFRDTLKNFYASTLDFPGEFDRAALNQNNQTSFDILQWDLNENLEALKFPDQLMPINQFWSLSITMGQLGAGSGIQPFETVKDYENFLMRAHRFIPWCDTAIANMKRGIAQNVTLPQVLAKKVLPQLQSMVVTDIHQSIFHMPIDKFPTSFSEADKNRLTDEYEKTISTELIPAYKRLYDFFNTTYIPACRNTTGISDLSFGKDYYNFLTKQWTTTTLTTDSIFNLGQGEVKRIRGEMEAIKNELGFKGTLKEFFGFVNTDKKYFPFKTDSEVIQGFRKIYETEKPMVNKMFSVQPKSPFRIQQTEKFRAASSSAEYQQGSADGSRPGIFYVPIIDATKFNSIAMETLFLHEAIPGHHFQISLQQENKELPDFRRFIWYGAYGEGWALYSESLGKEVGLYTDPIQKFGNLSEEMHRALRLVVDVGMHLKGWTREQAIQFCLENEAEGESDITSEVERYMAIPGQALAYKIGQLKIIALRNEAEKQLGGKFSYAEFHNQVLKDGCLPLAILESNIMKWIMSQK